MMSFLKRSFIGVWVLLTAVRAGQLQAQAKESCDVVISDCFGVPRLHDGVFIAVLCGVALLIVLYPILRFLAKQWSFRRDRIYGALAGDGVVHYYLQFRQGSPVVVSHPPIELVHKPHEPKYAKDTQNVYMEQFKKDFERWYGRKYYIAPTAMLAVLAVATAWWATGVLRTWSRTADLVDTPRALVMAALAGAFMWVVSDELDRLRRRDFTTSDVYYYVFRVLISIPFAWALSKARIGADQTVMTVPLTIPVAFFLGAFPTSTLFTLARRFVSQTLKLGEDQASGDLELEKLQSVVKSNAERFQDEDVNTITGLAYSDPIDLTIRTNFDLNYVVDCVSQALMWIYFDNNSAKLFQFSLRGAQEIAALVGWLKDSEHQAAAQKALADAAAAIGMDPVAFMATVDQVAEDPYTVFLTDVWS